MKPKHRCTKHNALDCMKCEHESFLRCINATKGITMNNQVREWCISADQFVAPEQRGNPSIMGKSIVEGVTDGEEKGIFTSAIRRVNGRIVTTLSGSIYTLVGEPHQHFRDLLIREGHTYNAAHPLDCFFGNIIKV